MGQFWEGPTRPPDCKTGQRPKADAPSAASRAWRRGPTLDVVVHEERIGVGRANEIMTLDHVLPAVQREPVREKLSHVRAKIVSFKPVRQPPERPPKHPVLLP